MNADAAVVANGEVRARSIYSNWYAERGRLMDVLANPHFDESARCTVILAAFASQLKFPLTLAGMRDVVGEDYWTRHCTINYIKASGKHFLYWDAHTEWFYVLLPSKSGMHRTYGLAFVASARLMDGQPGMAGTLTMPLETPVSRFTLMHPYLESELHEPGRTLLSKG